MESRQKRKKLKHCPVMFLLLVLLSVILQHHLVATAPRDLPSARQSNGLAEQKFNELNSHTSPSQPPLPATTTDSRWRATNDDRAHVRGEEQIARTNEPTAVTAVTDIETLSTSPLPVTERTAAAPADVAQQSVVDDSSIKANEPNRTTSGETARTTDRPIRRRTTTTPISITTVADDVPGEGSSTPVGSSPASVVPRKKMRRSTTTTTTTVLPLINPESTTVTTSRSSVSVPEPKSSSSSRSNEDIPFITSTSNYFDIESTSSPVSVASVAPLPSSSVRPKTRKLRKKVSRRPDLSESSTQSMITSTIREDEPSTTTETMVGRLRQSSTPSIETEKSTEGIREGMEDAKRKASVNLDRIIEMREEDGKEEEEKGGEKGTTIQSIDEHDRGNVRRVPVHQTTTIGQLWEQNLTESPEERGTDAPRKEFGVVSGEERKEPTATTTPETVPVTRFIWDVTSTTRLNPSSTTTEEPPTMETEKTTERIDPPTKLHDEKEVEEEEPQSRLRNFDPVTESGDVSKWRIEERDREVPRMETEWTIPTTKGVEKILEKVIEGIATVNPVRTTNKRPEAEVAEDAVETFKESATTETFKIPSQQPTENIFVTHTPSEVSSASGRARSSGEEDNLRLTSTTVFEDNSAITTTTEFISSTTTRVVPEDVDDDDDVVEQRQQNSETSSSTTTQRQPYFGVEESPKEVGEYKEMAIAPTTEPRVEGINVENVEEDLLPIPTDDVLVVEIEESSETIEAMTPANTTPTTTTVAPTEATTAAEVERIESQRPPKLNDELFYPIGGEGEGDGGEDIAETGGGGTEDDSNGARSSEDNGGRDESIDGRSNDNDGGDDFDLEAEIFPTIPAPKNPLFDSEILRERADLTRDDNGNTGSSTFVATEAAAAGPVYTWTSSSSSTEAPSTTLLSSPSSTTRTTTVVAAKKEGTIVESTSTMKPMNKTTDVSTVSHDSDTFFYISNTEVKVVESPPLPVVVVTTTTDQYGPVVVHKAGLSFAENPDAEDVPLALPDQNHSDRRVAAVELSAQQQQQRRHQHLPPPLNEENTIILSSSVAATMDNSGGGSDKSRRRDGVGGGGGEGINGEALEGFDFVKFAAADRPHKLSDAGDDDDNEDEDGVGGGGEGEDATQERVIQENREEELSFVRVEETTDVYSSEEAFEFLHKDHRARELEKAASRKEEVGEGEQEGIIPDIVIEPYPQITDTDNDLSISIGVPVIAELPPQIQISANGEEEGELVYMKGSRREENEDGENKKKKVHHFDIDNREVETMDAAAAAQRKNGKARKLKKSRGGKKQPANRKKIPEQFSEFVFENAESLLVKNPSISLEVPVLDFNFTILTTSTSTMEPKLNFTNETTLILEEEPIGINDLQTLFFTCFITLLLLVAAVFLAFVARFLWNKHYSYGTGLIGDNSTDPLATKSRTLSAEEFKSRDSGISMFKNHDLEATTDQYGNGIVPANSVMLNKNGDTILDSNGTATKQTPYATGANGSIITMTLKNNHLIVETEERSDISRDARETKMHYSPSDKDGVFVVEVARGADTSYHSPRSSIIVQQQQQQQLNQFNGVDLLNTSSTLPENSNNMNSSCSQEQQQQQQRVQVHHHPAPAAAQPSQVELANGKTKCSTGLSQSDLSDSSSGDSSNKEYNYGSQGRAAAYATELSESRLSSASSSTGNVLSGQQLKNGHRPVTKQETMDWEPRLQSDIDLFNVETERREHCNGHTVSEVQQQQQRVGSDGGVIPDILVKSSAATGNHNAAPPFSEGNDLAAVNSVES